MYFRILKNDLKRKKTMNFILLAFVILASMFVSASVNNIVTITNGLDYYFEKAGVPDYFVATMHKAVGEPVENILDGIEEIDSYGIEPVLYMNPDNLIYQGKKLETMQNTSVLLAIEEAKLNYFDEKDEVVREVKPGTVWISGKRLKENHMEVGDSIEINLCGVSETFEIAGSFKDAALGSDMMGMTRFIVNEKDFEKYQADQSVAEMYSGSLCYIRTGDTDAVEEAVSREDSSVIFLGDKNMIKRTYVLDMVIAGVLLVISVCLILIAFVVLRFTISFTLIEEYREIGVMKAIGVGNTKIRGLYLVKYFALAVFGAGIGFFASIPFGEALLKTVSQSVMLGNDAAMGINLGCSAAVVCVILLFCFRCTGRVKKFTPVDAIRNGTTGERFQKKGILRLENTTAKPPFFLAANDVLSSPRRFGTVILTFTLCLSLVLILTNAVNTLKGGNIITLFGLTRSDAYYSDEGTQMSFMVEDGRERLEKRMDEIEQILADNGIPARCTNEVMLKLSLIHGSHTCKSQVIQGIRTTADQYEYYEGTPPQNKNEIAVTPVTAEKLDAHIGDTITMRQSSGDQRYLITAFFQSMNNMGEGVRLHEDAEIDFQQTAGLFPIQIDFTDSPGSELAGKRIEKMKDIFDTDKIFRAGEYVDTLVGVAEPLNQVKTLVLLVVTVIVLLVTVLMERSFLAKEKGEIAILKATGFRTASIVKWHTVRFGIVGVAAAVISMLLAYPLTKVTLTPVFRMMGACYEIRYQIVYWEVYLLYPLAAIVLMTAAAWIASMYAGKITASQAAGTE